MLFVVKWMLFIGSLSVQASCKKDVPLREESPLVVLVSFSMPDSTLKALGDALKPLQGKLVFRGLFQNSFKKTQEKLLTLGCEAQIDPLIFRALKVTHVPVFVVDYEKDQRLGQWIAGNVSLHSALETLARKGSQGATALLKQQERLP